MAKRPVNAPKPGEQGFQKRKANKPKPPTPSASAIQGAQNGVGTISNMPPQEEIATLADLKRINEKVRQRRQPKITPSGGFIAATPNGTYLAFDGDDDPRHVGTYRTYREAFEAAETAAAGNIDQPAPEPSPPQWRGDYCTGVHPIYGGLNWGVKYQEHWNDYQVNHGYYGMSDERDGHTFIDGSRTPLAENEVRWTSDQRNQWDAETVWQHREYITEGLRRLGYGPTRSVRITTKVENTYIEVSNYDHPNAFQPFRVPLQDLA